MHSKSISVSPVTGFIALSAVFLLRVTAFGAEPPKSPELPVMGLSTAMQKKALGLEFEGTQVDVHTLKQQARTFIEFKRGSMSAKRKLLYVADCLSHPRENPFCEFMLTERKRGKKNFREIAQERAHIKHLSRELQKGELSSFEAVRESPVHRALRSFPDWAPLQKIADAALARKDCPPTALLIGLAQKTEEFFPGARYRNMATSLYSRMDQCGGDDDSTRKARFRLSLLHIWDANCKQAEPLLMKLSELNDGEYTARSLYWRLQCAEKSGNKALATQLRDRLTKDYQLTYHGLLAAGNAKHKLKPEIDETSELKEPLVRFRSDVDQELNRKVRAIEALLMHTNSAPGHVASGVADILDTMWEPLEKAETPFRLYVASLVNRMGDWIRQFRVLSSIFRDDPTSISRSTLEMFYPLRRFEVIEKHKQKVDPYLVAALIRQESGFNERARSPAGAMGLMQLMPGTARRMERVSKRELYDAKTNIRLGVRFFYHLLNRYDYNADLALAAYNAGPERVDTWRKRYPVADTVLFVDLIPFKETRDYVALISRNYFWYSRLYGPGAPGREPASTGKRLQMNLLTERASSTL